MSSNKQARQELERLYGKGDMFKKARIAEKIEARGGIKTYKKFKEGTKFKEKKKNQLEKRMTFHHLRHKANGGRTAPENGAIVNELAHEYLHSLPREQEEVINNMLREYKKAIDIAVAEVKADGVKQAKVISLPEVTEDCIEIPLETMTPEEQEIYEKHKRERNARIYEKFGVEYEQEL